MINHARTLLMNRARSRTHYSDYGYEYVPTTFQPIALPSTFSTIRQIIFGSRPDNYFLNFRVNELLSYIHNTELAEYIYRLDPRVTYWPQIGKPYFEPAGKRVSITQVYGSPQRLNVAGSLYALTALGKACNMYSISLRRAERDGSTVFEMDVRYEGRRDSRFTKTIRDFNSPPTITLPDTELNLRLNPSSYSREYTEIVTEINDFIVLEAYDTTTAARLSGEQLTLTDDTGLEAQWFVETKVNPAPVITTVMPAMELLGEPVYLELFGVEDKEPYLTFKNLWFDHPLPAYRLSGMVLALIYRTEELRGKNGQQ